MTTLKITKIGNSLGVILPKEILARMHLQKGDEVFVVESPDGITIRQSDPLFEHKMRLLDQIMHEDHDVLKKLAE